MQINMRINMWMKALSSAAAALGVSALPVSAGQMAQPFVTHPLEIATAAMVLAKGSDRVPELDRPEITAAVLSLLLVSELGLAEAYEEAVEGSNEDGGETGGEDGDAYGAAYGLLGTVHSLIAQLPAARDSADVADLLARLDALMPSAQRPQKLDADPEAAEVLAQALVGVLERETGAELYLGRDLATALGTISQMVSPSCAAGGTDPQAGARIIAGAFYYEETLEAPLSVMMPEAGETIEEAFETLVSAEAPQREACDALSGAFDEVAQLFGGALK